MDKKAAIDLIHAMVDELEKIWNDARVQGDTNFADKRIERWKKRSTQQISKLISEDEAMEFKNLELGSFIMGEMLGNLRSEIEMYQNHLATLQEEIENNPDFVFETKQETTRANQTEHNLNMLDERLIDSCKSSIESKDHWNLVFCAMRHLEVRIREKAQLSATDTGTDLVNKAFNPNGGKMRIPFCATVAEAEGFHHILRGIVMFHRNAKGHREGEIEKERAIQIVNYIDYLIDVINTATTNLQ